MWEKIFKAYLKRLSEIVQRGDAREETFYAALKDFLEEVAKAVGRSDVHVTVTPRPTEAGNPDFRVWYGKSRIVGYIEAKSPTVSLESLENSEQLKRYRSTFSNLLFTNFLEFRLYREGELVDVASLGRPFVLTQLRHTPPLENVEKVKGLLEKFLTFSLPRILTPESLAVELAKLTRFLRDAVYQRLEREAEEGSGRLLGFYEAFKKFLIGSLNEQEFSDLYAQTVTYGLFAARTRAEGGEFTRQSAFNYIPHTVGVLRDLFRYISLEEFPEELKWIVDDIAEILSVADVNGMMERYYREGKGSDPVVHFYETFLAHYDPQEREMRGVYYTPDPVVSYIVRSLHSILKSRFALSDGLASESVTLLDPAAGTMTFIARATELAVGEFTRKYGEGAKESFIRDHVLKNFYAFELMMAPYAVGHLKMAFFLEELGYKLRDDDRIPFYLTNTLDMSELEESRFPILSSLAEESRLAGRVKKEKPILVILGNPPYSVDSANKGEWIMKLLNDYKRIDGKPLREKNIKSLQDDYVKFIRFAQWKIEQTGRGVIGMITNHAYLDNPTFRGMRRSLMKSFDEIYVLDLHGNSLKKEKAPDGGKDENVFDIRVGVAISFFIKTGKGKGEARVFHADLWGTREHKYDWLSNHDFDTTDWKELKPKPEFYLFIPRDERWSAHYNSFLKITEIMPVHHTGIMAGRDRLTIHFTENEAWITVLNFSRMDPELARQVYKLGRDARDWKVTLAQQDLRDSGPDRKNIVPILYRPFDVRYTYYTGRNRGFLRWAYPDFMRHMLAGENVAICVGRQGQVVGVDTWDLAFCSEYIEDYNLFYRGGNVLLPLYLYPGKKDLHANAEERQPNLNPELLKRLKKAYGEAPTPEEILYYIYAVLYSPTYRERYADFLRIDFPRIPFTKDRELFKAMAALGKRLVDLHLLRSAELDPPLARFEGKGDGRVGKSRGEGFYYDAKSERVYINPSQYFAPVPKEVWKYTIGAYQVCDKWLKDRKGRKLSLDEIRTYSRIVTALARTIEVQKEIDEIFDEIIRTSSV